MNCDGGTGIEIGSASTMATMSPEAMTVAPTVSQETTVAEPAPTRTEPTESKSGLPENSDVAIEEIRSELTTPGKTGEPPKESLLSITDENAEKIIAKRYRENTDIYCIIANEGPTQQINLEATRQAVIGEYERALREELLQDPRFKNITSEKEKENFEIYLATKLDERLKSLPENEIIGKTVDIYLADRIRKLNDKEFLNLKNEVDGKLRRLFGASQFKGLDKDQTEAILVEYLRKKYLKKPEKGVVSFIKILIILLLGQTVGEFLKIIEETSGAKNQ